MPLAHDELGRGEPWVFLHGFPLTRKLWAPQAPLAEAARLILPDLRGHGASPRASPATMEAMAEDVLALCDELGAQRFGLVGLSMGGYVALALQRTAPERVARLALVDTQAAADTEEARARREELARRLEDEGIQVLVRDFMVKLLGPAAQGDPALVGKVRAMVLSNEPEGMAQALRGMAQRPDHRGRLGEIACPVLAVVGQHDEVTPPARAEEMARGVPHGKLVVLAGAGHLSSLEQPEDFNRALLGFMGSGLASAEAGASLAP